MVIRPYKCPLCHSSFKNESGMKWHLVHRHEIPNAFDALGKEYEIKTAKLIEENALLEKKARLLEEQLKLIEMELIKEKGEKALESAKVIKLNEEMRKMAMSLVLRDKLIKERLNIDLPSPF
jgi:threonyl-tRNA synthetase